MMTAGDIERILNNLEDMVLDPLRKYKGWDDNTTAYLGYAALGASIYKFMFEWEYIDEEDNDRTLGFDICINITNIRDTTWVDQKAHIPAALPEPKKVLLRLSYLIWHVVEELEHFFDDDTPEADKICNSKKNKMRVLVFPSGGYRFDIFE